MRVFVSKTPTVPGYSFSCAHFFVSRQPWSCPETMRPQTPWTHRRGGRRFLVRLSSELKVLKVHSLPLPCTLPGYRQTDGKRRRRRRTGPTPPAWLTRTGGWSRVMARQRRGAFVMHPRRPTVCHGELHGVVTRNTRGNGGTTFVVDSTYAIDMATGRTIPANGRSGTNRLLWPSGCG